MFFAVLSFSFDFSFLDGYSRKCCDQISAQTYKVRRNYGDQSALRNFQLFSSFRDSKSTFLQITHTFCFSVVPHTMLFLKWLIQPIYVKYWFHHLVVLQCSEGGSFLLTLNMLQIRRLQVRQRVQIVGNRTRSRGYERLCTIFTRSNIKIAGPYWAP